MTKEQIQQKVREAKALQQKMQTITDSEERKLVAQQMNELFAEASALKKQAKHQRYQEESIEREFISMVADWEDD